MDAVLEIFAANGIQWMGWGLCVILIGLLHRSNSTALDVIVKNTEVLTRLTTIVERLPPGGR